LFILKDEAQRIRAALLGKKTPPHLTISLRHRQPGSAYLLLAVVCEMNGAQGAHIPVLGLKVHAPVAQSAN
jgi:hypothetical protein